MKPRHAFALSPGLLLLLATGASLAQSQVLSGRLDDPANTALVASDLGSPVFTSAAAIANNVALYTLNVPVAGAVTIVSTGFASGGVDPYFTLLKGAGTAATYFASNYTQAFSTGGDFSYSATLAAGSYRIALGSFANLSFAENLGSGTLADGFTALGVPAYLGNSSYRLVVTTPVPEPAAWLLLALGLPLLLQARMRQD